MWGNVVYIHINVDAHRYNNKQAAHNQKRSKSFICQKFFITITRHCLRQHKHKALAVTAIKPSNSAPNIKSDPGQDTFAWQTLDMTKRRRGHTDDFGAYSQKRSRFAVYAPFQEFSTQVRHGISAHDGKQSLQAKWQGRQTGGTCTCLSQIWNVSMVVHQ